MPKLASHQCGMEETIGLINLHPLLMRHFHWSIEDGNINLSDFEREIGGMTVENFIIFLELELNNRTFRHFYSISAMVTWSLFRLCFLKDMKRKTLTYLTRCVSPPISQFLWDDLERFWLNKVLRHKKITIKMEDKDESFLEYFSDMRKVGEGSRVMAEICFEVKSLLSLPFMVNKIEANLIHSVTGFIKCVVAEDIVVLNSILVKVHARTGYLTPGLLYLQNISIFIGNVEFVLPDGLCGGEQSFEIPSYEKMCTFAIELTSKPITCSEVSLLLRAMNLPAKSEKVDLHISILSGNAIIMNSPDGHSLNLSKYDVSREVDFSCSVQTSQPESARIEAVWDVIHEEDSLHGEVIRAIQFYRPFSVSFKLFDNEREPIKIQDPVIIEQYSKYILMFSVEAQIPGTTQISCIDFNLPQSFVIHSEFVELPVHLQENEALSAALIFSCTSADQPQPGYLEIEYTTEDLHPMSKYSLSLPLIQCEDSLFPRPILDEGVSHSTNIGCSSPQISRITPSMLNISA